MTFDDSKFPYNNPYELSKRFAKILFVGGRPVFNWELNELQSMTNHEISALGDSIFQEGSVIAGMTIIPKEDSKTSGSQGLPNNFMLSSLNTENASVSTTTYATDGNLVVKSTSTLSNAYPQVDFSGVITKGIDASLTFELTKTSGELDKISFLYDDTQLTPTDYTIDGITVQNKIDDVTASPLTDTSGSQINLNDGKTHTIKILFKTLQSADTNISLVFNGGQDMLTKTFTATVGKLYLHDGTTSQAWQPNDADSNAPTSMARTKNYTVTDGKIWLNGAVRNFLSQDIAIKGVGVEKIGVKLVEKVITAKDDPALIDHTNGSATNGVAGADRLQYTVELTYNDDTATPFAVFQDNRINPNMIKPDYTKLNAILAKRTYDQSGSFRVSGFDAHTRNYPLDDSKIELDIDAGLAYVQGYQISTTKSMPVLLDKATQTGHALNDSYQYTQGKNKITLRNQPVKVVDSVTANFETTNANVVRSGVGTSDTFSSNNVTAIVKVWDSSNTYIQGTDYSWDGSTTINWGVDVDGKPLLNAKIPKGTYSVMYQYTQNLSKNTDYTVTTDDSNNTIITLTTKTQPINGSLINVTYDYFLARVDLVLITANQESPFTVQKGTPMPLATAKPPLVTNDLALELGYVVIYPNSDKADFVMQTVTNLPFSKLQRYGTRLDNLEYNIVANQLSQTAQKQDNPITTRDAFTDSFNTVDKALTTYSDFSVAYDPVTGTISIDRKASADLVPTVAEDLSNTAILGNIASAPYTEVLTFAQLNATDQVNINEYEVFNVNGFLELDPAQDNWIDHQTTTVQTTSGEIKHISMNLWWRHMYSVEDMRNHMNFDTINNFGNVQGIDWSDPSIHDGSKLTGYILSSGGQQTVTNAIEYMRSRPINFTAHNFKAFSDNFTITIAGIPVQAPTPLNDTYKGTKPNSFRADATGTIKGSFTIPAGTIHCGSRTVLISNDSNDQASTQYIANGTMETTENILNKTVVEVSAVDPLAQSFNVTQDCYLSSINVYFASKASSASSDHSSDVIVQLRELSDDGYPTRTVVASTVLTPDDISTSEDASVPTKIRFQKLVQLKHDVGYALTLITDTNQYNLFKATRGQAIIDGDHHVIGGSPNANGTMFTSQNAQTWVADPNSSLKFQLYTAHFEDKGEIIFNPINLTQEAYIDDPKDGAPVDIDKITLLTTYLTPTGNTGLQWFFRVLPYTASGTIQDQPWQPISPVNNGVIVSSPATDIASQDNGLHRLFENSKQVQLRVVMTAGHGLSPMLYLPSLSLRGLLTGKQGNYISINTNQSGEASFNKVKLQYDASIPSGCNVVPKYSVDGGSTWYTLADNGKDTAQPKSVQVVDSDFKRYQFECKVPGTAGGLDLNHLATQFMCRLELSSETNFYSPRVRKLVVLLKDE